MPSFGLSFGQLSAYFHGINPGPSATSAQSNWLAGAAEAQQLADELMKNVQILQQLWSGPAATQYYKAMNAIAEFAYNLANDMTNMANGLSSMSTQASSIKPQAIALINAARSNPYSRAAAIAPLTAMLNQLGGSYLQNRSTYWKEPSQAPAQLPKAGNETESQPQDVGDPGFIRPAEWLERLQDLREVVEMGEFIYDAFNPDDFPSGVTGELPPPHGVPGGPGGGVPGWDGTGPLPSPDHPDYQPLPVPDADLTDPDTEPETSLASAAPTVPGASPALSLATGGGPGMGGGMGAVPMAGMGVGMGAAGASARSAPAARPGTTPAGGMFAPGMMGAGMRRGEEEEDSGHRTWLTEDDMAWDGEPAPSGVVGGSR
ncbi:hypothetical protein LX16_3276 [Stackebrandtia albiflava]|uniref:PPE family protein n=1 Tax=Stackebrandtia albiflava TaxID=406432 RepID=A0A562V3X5_9ACTN|nr:hypothetical protein [Stackebrandtia albiflava]TWJ12517.1 hypothetical protein LX16_3276 [Stackebrandtia albiflava]